jgi:hypothetical protein
MTPQEIIPDYDIERIHGNSNFGDTGKRDVVDQAILKAACRYHNGWVSQMIITQHGLVKEATNSYPKLTEKGRKYLFAVYQKTFT